MRRFNGAPAEEIHEALLRCCGSDRWARRLAAHRPYPDVAALLAAADEAAYDLSPADLSQALAAETAGRPCAGASRSEVPQAALTALRAAFAAYEASFGHTFVISLEGRVPDEYLDQMLAGIRTRLGNDREEERAVAADELRRLSRTRLGALLARQAAGPDDGRAGPASPADRARNTGTDHSTGRTTDPTTGRAAGPAAPEPEGSRGVPGRHAGVPGPGRAPDGAPEMPRPR